ncbi:MAG: TlpA family protein disulfide reductase [Firmicutes bacterium]|nr:TlpA family protein disulfide reductase [Bacillota bacterium]
MSAEKRTRGQILPKVGVLALLVLLIGSGLYYYGFRQKSVSYSDGQVTTGPFAGEIAPDFTLPDLDGEMVALSDYRGKYVFLNFFATWCNPCKSELPDFNRMNLRMQREGMNATFLLVNVRESPETVKSFMEQNGYTMKTLTDVSGAVAAKYLVQGIPMTLIIGPDGKIITKRVGAISASLLETLVEQVVE